MDLIQWINGEPFAVGLHRKKILVGGFEKLSDLEREALQYEADWHDKYNVKGDQYGMNFQNGGVVIGDKSYTPLEKQQSIEDILNSYYKNMYAGLASLILGSPQVLKQSGINAYEDMEKIGKTMFSPEMKNKNLFSKKIFPIAGNLEDFIKSGIGSLNNGR